MLSPEHFAKVSKDMKGVSGIAVVALARSAAEMKLAGTDKRDRGVYIIRGQRQYRLERIGDVIEIEGLVIPKYDANATLKEKLERIEAMLPVTILPSGVIESNGVRVSPHDPRLSVLASDLISPVPLSPEVYQKNAAAVTNTI